MLRTEKIKKRYYSGLPNERIALDEVSLNVAEAELGSVIGTNGAGKTSLLRAVAGEFSLDSGKIYIGSHDVSSIPAVKRARFLGRVFQDPVTGTFGDFSIEENLAIADGCNREEESPRGRIENILRLAVRKKRRDFYREQLSGLQLGLEARLDQKVKLLSGGQRQALSMAMAILTNPKLLLLDEHCAALDPRTAEKVMESTYEVVKRHGVTTLMVTHHLSYALEYSDVVFIMDQGRLIKTVRRPEIDRLAVQDLIQMFDTKLDRLSGRREV